jgi:hypothetical protein
MWNFVSRNGYLKLIELQIYHAIPGNKVAVTQVCWVGKYREAKSHN